LKGEQGDAMHTVLCTAGFNMRCLMRAIAAQVAKAIKGLFFILFWLVPLLRVLLGTHQPSVKRNQTDKNREPTPLRTGVRTRHKKGHLRCRMNFAGATM
jgi:hypothetical protein